MAGLHAEYFRKLLMMIRHSWHNQIVARFIRDRISTLLPYFFFIIKMCFYCLNLVKFNVLGIFPRFFIFHFNPIYNHIYRGTIIL